MERPSSNHNANEVAIVVDCDKAEYFPILRSKFGTAKTVSTRSLKVFEEFDPAVFNIPLLFSTLREKPKDMRASDNVLMNPYPIYRDSSGEVHVDPPNAELQKVNSTSIVSTETTAASGLKRPSQSMFYRRVAKRAWLSATLSMSRPGVLFIRVGNDSPAKLETGFTDAQYCRKFSYCDRRNDTNDKISDSYGIYDYKYSRAYLGVKGKNGRAIAGVMFQELPDALTVFLRTGNVMAAVSENAILALRVDFLNDRREATKSVLLASSILDRNRDRALPWGNGGALADVFADGSLLLDGRTTLDVANYAPNDWSRKAILSFWMEGTGDESMTDHSLVCSHQPSFQKRHMPL